MLKQSTRTLLLTITIVLFLPIVMLQKVIDPGRHQFEPKLRNVQSATGQLPLEFALGAATGFREAIAGLLWVRTDKFFHEGNYDAIVPMVRTITWLDPHNIDVYQTGAWHLDYNFTDSDQRSDRRYIPYAIALLDEAIENNPDTTKLYADLAFTHYFRKLCNFEKSILWYERAQNGWQDHTLSYWDATLHHDKDGKLVPNQPVNAATLGTGGILTPELAKEAVAIYAKNPVAGAYETDADPTIVGHGLAHAYQAAGQVDKAIAEWAFCVEEHQRFIREHPDTAMQDMQGLMVARKNLGETILRKKWRVTQTQPPADFKFEYSVERTSPMVLTISGSMAEVGATKFDLVTGQHTFGPQGGCRISVRLEDADYKMPATVEFGLKTATDLPHGVTVMQDSISVRDDGTFKKTLDMSKDHFGLNPMYSFTAQRYRITLWFNPADPNSAAPNIQDRIGWVGEGLTDKLIDTTGIVPGSAGYVEPRLRQIEKVLYVTKDDLTGEGSKVISQ